MLFLNNLRFFLRLLLLLSSEEEWSLDEGEFGESLVDDKFEELLDKFDELLDKLKFGDGVL